MKNRTFKMLTAIGLLLAACGKDDSVTEPPSDGAWGTPVELQRVPPLAGLGTGLRLERPTVAVDDQGNALVVWEEVAVARGFGFPQALGFSSFTRARGWSAASRLESSQSPPATVQNLEPRLVAVGGGAFVVAWQSGAHVFTARFDSATGWGPKQDLGPGGGPALAVNGAGAVVAAWHGSFDGVTETRGTLLSRLDRGAFSPPVRVDAPQPIDNRPDDPSVALDPSGNATVVFPRSLDLVAARLGAGQSTPEPEVLLADAAHGIAVREAPATGVDAAGRVTALWRQADAGTAGTQSLWASRYTPGAGWTTPGLVEDSPASVFGYAVAVSSGGDAWAAWSFDPPADAQASRFTAGAWTPRVSLLLDARGGSVPGRAGPPSLGIDTSGNLRAHFESDSLPFENRFSPTGGWRGAATLPGTGQPRVAVSASGEAVVVLAPVDLTSLSASRFGLP